MRDSPAGETPMRIHLTVFTAGLLILSTAVFAQKPSQDVSRQRHPNIAAAQRLVDQAFKRITDAQRANEWDLGGHAEKAKQLLDQANAELKQAAEAANRR